MLVRGFDPLEGRNALAIILGTIPGRESLAASEYYAENRNAFWFIMDHLFGASRSLNYYQRCEVLIRNRVAVWDVLRSARRIGSSDSDIEKGTEEPNDFVAFFHAHLEIRTIFFNGGRAADIYKALVVPILPASTVERQVHVLASTSPTNTHISWEEKLQA